VPDARTDFTGGRRIQRSRWLVEQQEAQTIKHGFGRADAGLLTRRQQAAFGVAKRNKIELAEQGFDAFPCRGYPIQHGKHAQVLPHRQITGQRGA
jgi:hypothetical protein